MRTVHRDSPDMAQRVHQAKTAWLVTGVLASALLVCAMALTSVLQWGQAETVVHVWHKSSMSVVTQSLSIQIEALLQRKSQAQAQSDVAQYFNRTIQNEPKLVALVLRDQQGHVWASVSSNAGGPVLNALEAQSSRTQVPSAEHVQSLRMNEQFVWLVTARLNSHAHPNWTLQVLFDAPDDSQMKTALTRNSVILSLVGIAILFYLLQRLWREQIAIPRAHWDHLGQQAATGVWVSDVSVHRPHPLTRASHALVQRVTKRSQWLAWQRNKLAREVSSDSAQRGPD